MGNVFDILISEPSLRLFFKGESSSEADEISLTFVQRNPPIKLPGFSHLFIKVTELARKKKISIDNQIRDIIPSHDFNRNKYTKCTCLLFMGKNDKDKSQISENTFGFLIGLDKSNEHETIGIWPPEKILQYPNITEENHGKDIVDKITRAIDHPSAYSQILVIT